MRERIIDRDGVTVTLKVYDDCQDPPYAGGLVKWAGERIRVYAEAPMEDGGLWIEMFLVSIPDIERLTPMMADACLQSMRKCEDAQAARAA